MTGATTEAAAPAIPTPVAGWRLAKAPLISFAPATAGRFARRQFNRLRPVGSRSGFALWIAATKNSAALSQDAATPRSRIGVCENAADLLRHRVRDQVGRSLSAWITEPAALRTLRSRLMMRHFQLAGVQIRRCGNEPRSRRLMRKCHEANRLVPLGEVDHPKRHSELAVRLVIG